MHLTIITIFLHVVSVDHCESFSKRMDVDLV